VEITSKFKSTPWVYAGTKVDMSGQEGEEESKTKMEDEDEGEEVKVSDEDSEVIAALTKELKGTEFSKHKKLAAADFEKDDDENHHIDFLTAATNLRSYNYQIKLSTRQKVRMVAGKIIPAIATTTAMITGFVQLELLKYVQKRPLESHRAATVNLGTNTFCVELLPDPNKKKSGMDQATYMEVKAVPEGWTVWDKIDINSPGVTVGEFVESFPKNHHNCKLELVTSLDGKIIFLDSNKEQTAQNAKRKLKDVYEEVTEGPIHPPGRKYVLLSVAGETEDGDVANMPMVRLVLE